jgi:Glycosyl hydrolase family 79 C-terminal beta domain
MRRWSRRRFVLVDLALVALVAGITAVAVSVSSGSREVPDDAAMVTVDSSSYGRPIPAGFLGLSLEYSSIEHYAGTDSAGLDPVFERLVANLNPGQAPVLRIGGDTTDWTWWPVPGVTKPAGVTYSLSDRWMQVTRALAKALGARLILGINLEADSTQIAGTEARQLVDGLGRGSVQALELGNEPALYGSFPWYRTASGRKVPGRPRGYDVPAYIRDFDRFSAALPSVPLAGPALGASKWMRDLGPFLSSQPRLGLVTMHRYPLQLCYTSTKSAMHPSLPHLMASAATTGLADSFARDVAVAHAHRLPLRVDEINSVSCGADRAVSDTVASSLWAVDAMFELARVGIDGVNLHTFPGAGYELFRIAHDGGRWTAAVAPEYYGLILFAHAAPPGSTLLRVSGQAGGQIKTWATRARDGTIRVVAINKGRNDRDLALRLPGSGRTATLQRLRGPSLTAPSGVTLGGQSFGAVTDTGELSGALDTDPVKATDGRYVVHLPAGSAALLTTG